MMDPGGSAVAIVRDIAERKRIEARLAESEARFRTMADHAPVMLWMAGLDSLCDFFNRGWLEFTGRTMEQELGAGWAEGVHPEDFQNCMHVYLSAFVERQPFRMEYRLRRHDGHYRWILDQGLPRFTPGGTFAGYIGSCIDITDQKELQQDLDARVRARTTELATRLREREVLLREVHHRVKNNLQLVSSLLRMQGRQTRDASVAAALGECQNRIQTIALIHERLYRSPDISRVSFSEYAKSLAAQVVNVGGISPAAVALEMDVADVALSIDRAIPCGLVLNELLTNALKHGFPGGRRGKIRVELRATGSDRLTLVVSDNGIGLPPNLDVRRTDSLGLQLVSMLTEQLHGQLEVESEGGTTFRISFSAAPDHPHSEPAGAR